MERIPTTNLFSLNGKTAIVTGATQPLAAEMSLTMAEAGANIIALISPWDPDDADLKSSIHAVGREIRIWKADVGDTPSLRACFKEIWKAVVTPDILLNFSTINRRGPVEEMMDEDIDVIFAVNLKGAYIAAQEFGLRLIALNRPGKIINFASMTAHLPMTNVSAYAAAKAGVVQMTRALSNEWAPRDIQVNCISPGYTKTSMTSSLLAEDPGMESYITSRTPAGRWGVPEDYRGVILFLSSQASDFVTGTTVVVDGGMMVR
ncbi:hypothetical protein BDW59DRAFT_168669 [Aspergillus cavernicola]|uniref:2-deoxy-D-gluconate 3-dehydrogenase n=1 Tax=Aspergillus cavernicola TaxID=176166 RepID=A0ABR4J2Y2_9EURO